MRSPSRITTCEPAKMPYDEGHTFDSLVQVHKEGRLDFSLVPEQEKHALKKATAVASPRFDNCSDFATAILTAVQQMAVEQQPKKSWVSLPILVGSMALLATLGWFGSSAWFGADDGPPPTPVVTKQPYSISFSPNDTKFQLEVISDNETEPVSTIDGQGQASVTLAEGDNIRVSAKVKSEIYVPLDKTFTQDELDEINWRISLQRRTLDDIRKQASTWIKSDQWDQAVDLLANVSIEEPTVLDIPVPEMSNHDKEVIFSTAGSHESSYALVTLNKNNEAVFSFCKTDSDSSSNDKWIDSNLKGVDQIFELPEVDQWLVVLTNSVGAMDEGGRYSEIWKADANELVSISAAVVSEDGKLLATGDLSGTVRLWQISMDGSLENYQALNLHTESVKGMAFGGDGKFLVTISTDQTVNRLKISLGDKPTVTPIKTPEGFKDLIVIGTSLTDDDRILVATEEKLFVTDLNGDPLLMAVEHEKRPENSDALLSIVRSSPNSPWVLIGTDSLAKPLQLFNLRTKRSVYPDGDVNYESIAEAAFSGDGQTVAISTYRGDLILVDLSHETPTWHSLAKSTDGYRKFICFPPGDNHLVTIADTSKEEIWSIADCRLIFEAREAAAKNQLEKH